MYPTELTIASMIALLKALDLTLSTEESMNLVLEYKRVNKKTRTTVTKTFDTFPADVSDFLLAYPGRYQRVRPLVGARSTLALSSGLVHQLLHERPIAQLPQALALVVDQIP